MGALIFDMDGVLVDSQIHWKAVDYSFLERLIPSWDAGAQRSILGMSVHDLYLHLQRNYQLGLPREEFIASYQELSAEIYGTKCRLFPGVRELMGRMSDFGWKIAVASSSPRLWMEIVLERFALRERLDLALSSDDVGARTKPSPDIYLEASRKLGVPAEYCVAIEDTAKGVASAKAAGMSCVGFRNGYNAGEDLTLADLECTDFGELSARSLGMLRL